MKNKKELTIIGFERLRGMTHNTKYGWVLKCTDATAPYSEKSYHQLYFDIMDRLNNRIKTVDITLHGNCMSIWRTKYNFQQSNEFTKDDIKTPEIFLNLIADFINILGIVE